MEPTSSLSYVDLASHVGDFLGYGPAAPFGDSGSSNTNTARIDRAVRGGVRKVYSPVPPYDWNFLHVFITLELPANCSIVTLPADLYGIEGDLIITLAGQPTTGSLFPEVEMTSPEFIKANLATAPASTGYPLMAAIETLKGTTLYSGQQKQLIFYPAADQAYLLSFQYYVVPDAPLPPPPTGTVFGTPNPSYPGLPTGNPYVYGGAVHSETFKEACLAEAEVLYNDMAGLHTGQFQQRILASVAVDRRSKPQYLGKNADASDKLRRRMRGWYGGPARSVLYNGTSVN